MANEQNLRKLSTSEAREIGSKGGKASVNARRRKKLLRKAASEIISMIVDDPSLLELIRRKGFEKEGMTYQEAMIAGMVYAAICGDSRAYKAIKDTVEPPGENTMDGALDKLDQILEGIGEEAQKIETG